MGSKGANKDFDYNLIKILDAIISAGNATKAAKRLGITPAAVSIALKRLQSHYHEELFIRGKDGLLPTAKALEIHYSFRQVIELVGETFQSVNKKSDKTQITILGSDIIESYYLSQLSAREDFEQILVSHFSSRNIEREQIIERLFTSDYDLLISADPIIVPGIDHQLIDSFKSFVCICSGSHMLCQLSQLSLHHFYTSRHAQYQSGTSIPEVINDSALLMDERWYKAKRNIGYRSDSINGLISMVERSSMIALIPLKIALFYKNQRKYDIKIIQPPPELSFRPVQVYASWKKNSRNLAVINGTVSMLHTLSSFRR